MSESPSRVHRYLTDDFTVRAAAVDATAVVREMQQLHGAKPLATVAVGRAMIGSLLMASQLKEGQQVGLYIRGNGSLRAVYAEAHFEGQVRGYTPMSQYEPPTYTEGLSLKEAIGHGTLTIARHQPFQKQPHQGTVALVSGEIGEDVAHYLHQSHQIRSLVSLGVYLDTYGQVQAAGGVIIEVMPGVEDELVEKIQKNADAKPLNVSKLILGGARPIDLIQPYLADVPFTEIAHNHPVVYSCPCTKDRVIRALETLGLTELMDMINKSETAAVTCEICGRPYKVSVEELTELHQRLYKESLN